MNVSTITMKRAVAREKLNAYKQRLRIAYDAEYEAAATAYEQLAQGKALIGLTDAFEQAGEFTDGRPRLAIARADRRQVQLLPSWAGSGNSQYRFNASKTSRPTDTLLRVVPTRRHSWERGFALVPIVPADVRLACRKPLTDTFVLWEVEQWADTRINSRPDRDPFLLTHLAGDLYVVEAAWDLTEIERLIMAGRNDE